MVGRINSDSLAISPSRMAAATSGDPGNTSDITAAAAIGDKIFKVDAATLAAISKGFWAKIGGEDLGRCVRVDKDINEIETETALVSAVASGQPILHTEKWVPRLRISTKEKFSLLTSKIGGHNLAKNEILRVHYKNIEGSAKVFSLVPEFLY